MGVVSGYFWYTDKLKPVSDSSKRESFVIKENETATSILNRLESQGLIKSALASRIYLRINPLANNLRPGAYVLTASNSATEIIKRLSSGPQDVWVTIPEGWRKEQIALRVDSTLSGISDRFDPVEFIKLTKNLEGQLFPDTYLLPLDATAQDVVRILTTNFAKKTGLSMPNDQNIVILASLIERESRVPSERPIIAGILKNRLDNGWLLNVDATIQYARDSLNCPNLSVECKYWTPIYDTKLPSLYNTYIHLGLPPTAISNPGLSSIEAAKNPSSTPYFFYLHDPTGQVHYAVSLAEHNQNVDKYLRP